VNPLLSLALLAAASVHFVQLGDHAEESPYLAAGFLIAGVLQLLLAAVVVVRPSRPAYRTVVVVNVFLILLYVGHVLVGIPLPTGAGLEFVLSPRESVDVYGVITVIAEVAAVALAYAGLFAGARPQPAAN